MGATISMGDAMRPIPQSLTHGGTVVSSATFWCYFFSNNSIADGKGDFTKEQASPAQNYFPPQIGSGGYKGGEIYAHPRRRNHELFKNLPASCKPSAWTLLCPHHDFWVSSLLPHQKSP